MYSSQGRVTGWEGSRHTCVEVVNAAAADLGGPDIIVNDAGIPGIVVFFSGDPGIVGIVEYFINCRIHDYSRGGCPGVSRIIRHTSREVSINQEFP